MSAAVSPSLPEVARDTVPAALGHLRDTVLDAEHRRVRFEPATFFASPRLAEYDRLVLGTRSAYDVTHRRKFVDREDWPLAAHELARPYLRHIHTSQRTESPRAMAHRRVPWRTGALAMLDIPAPLYYPGVPVTGDLAYVDIDAAYFQLYECGTLDLDFDPVSVSIGYGRVDFLHREALRESKALRNCIVGCTRATAVDEVRRGVHRRHRTYNPHLAPCLWGYLAHTLHAVMREAIERFGACYVHTDGMIVHRSKADAVLAWLREDWRLHARIVAQGPGRVTGIGSHVVGEKRTRVIADNGQPICNLLDLDPELHAALRRWRGWLLDRPERGERRS